MSWFRLRLRFRPDDPPAIGTDPCRDVLSRLKPAVAPAPLHPAYDAGERVFGFRHRDLISLALSSRHCEILTALSPTSQRAALSGLRAAAEILRNCRGRSMPLGDHARTRAALLRRAHQTAVGDLFRSSARLETQIRALAWALDWGGRSKGAPVRLVRSEAADWDKRERSLPEAVPKTSTNRAVVFWISDKCLPPVLVEAARRRGAVIVADAESCGTEPMPGNLLLDVNPAWISRPGPDGASSAIRITGVAGLAQATLGTAPRSAWKMIELPMGFNRLHYDIRASEHAALLECGFTAAIPSGRPGGEIVVSAGSIPKSSTIGR